MTAPSRATPAGRAYLDLRAKVRGDRRPVDELLQLYVLEPFLARLAGSRFAEHLVLKGGVLLAAFGERRATRDIDLQAQALDDDPESIRAVICDVAAQHLDDGVLFDVGGAITEVIRDEDAYSGVRVSMRAELATARPHFHVDVNVGDPITPAPQELHLPRLLGGEVVARGYPLVMVHAGKIVTAVARGTVNNPLEGLRRCLSSEPPSSTDRSGSHRLGPPSGPPPAGRAASSRPRSRRLRRDRTGAMGNPEEKAAARRPRPRSTRRGGLGGCLLRGSRYHRHGSSPRMGSGEWRVVVGP